MQVATPPVASHDRPFHIPAKDTRSSIATSHGAVFKDTISCLSDPLASMSSVSSLISLLAIAYRSRSRAHPQQERLVTLLYTLSPPPAPGAPKKYAHEELVSSFVHLLSPVLNGMAGMADFQAAVESFSQPDDFCDFWMLEGRNLMRELIQNESIVRPMEGFDLSFLDIFVKDTSCRVGYGKDTGELVLVPATTQIGDEVILEHANGQGL